MSLPESNKIKNVFCDSSLPLNLLAPFQLLEIRKKAGTDAFCAVMFRNLSRVGQEPDFDHPFIETRELVFLTETDLVHLVNALRDERLDFKGVDRLRDNIKEAVIALWDAIHRDLKQKAHVSRGYGLSSGSHASSLKAREPVPLGTLYPDLIAA